MGRLLLDLPRPPLQKKLFGERLSAETLDKVDGIPSKRKFYATQRSSTLIPIEESPSKEDSYSCDSVSKA